MVIENGSLDLETTASLLARVRAGDGVASDLLMSRYLPILRRWAHGRLPARARDLLDTDDLVQITLVRALDHVKRFEPRREGAFLAWLRRILMNRLRDEVRSRDRRPGREGVMVDLAEPRPSPLEQAMGEQTLEFLESALSTLTELQQEAIVLRIEFGFTYPAVAEALDLPSAGAARMMVTRALVRVAEVMDETR